MDIEIECQNCHKMYSPENAGVHIDATGKEFIIHQISIKHFNKPYNLCNDCLRMVVLGIEVSNQSCSPYTLENAIQVVPYKYREGEDNVT